MTMILPARLYHSYVVIGEPSHGSSGGAWISEYSLVVSAVAVG
ncbi:hypothetical protein OVY29_08065 [Sphingopyxis sp. SE2]|nr:hypothetical protein [Sphingopyxis sp. SE2]MDT7528608.1 hypothetical protein [Sphingopyxis sp. SE2]